jgi:hypothetical protein
MMLKKSYALFILLLFLSLPVAFAQEAGGIAVPPEAVDDNVLSSDGVVGNPHDALDESLDELSETVEADAAGHLDEDGVVIQQSSSRKEYGTCVCDETSVQEISDILDEAHRLKNDANDAYFAFMKASIAGPSSLEITTEALTEITDALMGYYDSTGQDVSRLEAERIAQMMYHQSLPDSKYVASKSIEKYKQAYVKLERLADSWTKCDEISLADSIEGAKNVMQNIQTVIKNTQVLEFHAYNIMITQGRQFIGLIDETTTESVLIQLSAETDLAFREMATQLAVNAAFFVVGGTATVASLKLLAQIGPFLRTSTLFPRMGFALNAAANTGKLSSAAAQAAASPGVAAAGGLVIVGAGNAAMGEAGAAGVGAEVSNVPRVLAAGEGAGNAGGASGAAGSNPQNGASADELVEAARDILAPLDPALDSDGALLDLESEWSVNEMPDDVLKELHKMLTNADARADKLAKSLINSNQIESLEGELVNICDIPAARIGDYSPSIRSQWQEAQMRKAVQTLLQNDDLFAPEANRLNDLISGTRSPTNPMEDPWLVNIYNAWMRMVGGR